MGQGLNIVAFNFAPSQSELVNRSAFPLLIANIVTSFRSEGRIPLGATLPEGAVRLEGEREVPARAADVPGLYRVGSNISTASLLSGEESRLPTPAATAPTETNATPGAARATPFAFWFILLALLFLLAEWLLWSRGRQGWTWKRQTKGEG